jgi:hypothetical protein
MVVVIEISHYFSQSAQANAGIVYGHGFEVSHVEWRPSLPVSYNKIESSVNQRNISADRG